MDRHSTGKPGAQGGPSGFALQPSHFSSSSLIRWGRAGRRRARFGLAVARGDVLGAVRVPGFEPNTIARSGLALYVGSTSRSISSRSPSTTRARPHSLSRCWVEKCGMKMCARSFSLRWPSVMYCRLPPKSAKASVWRADGLQEARRPAAMLDIGPAVGAGRREEEGVDDAEELAEIVGDLRLPLAALEHRAAIPDASAPPSPQARTCTSSGLCSMANPASFPAARPDPG